MSDTMNDGPAPAPLSGCTSCGGGTLRRDRVKTALWRGEDLVVIEDIPALVCIRCGERYFEDETAMALDMMQAGQGAQGRPRRSLSVPVYGFTAPEGGSGS
nr:type II toxin-antitoxin system MqsA family antitoxin [Roseovarius bejariae]